MKIYRLEDSCKTGVYQGALRPWRATPVKLNQQYSGDQIRHPTPENDSKFVESYRAKGIQKYDWAGRYVFGFESPAQVFRWFFDYDDLIALEYADYHVSVYECDDVIVGNTQVAFSAHFHLFNQPIQIISMCEFIDKFSSNANQETHR